MRQIWLFAIGLSVLLVLNAAAWGAPVQIVAFGGSNTYGKTVSRADAYPAQLEALLKADGFDVTVRNEGVNGIKTYEELMRVDSVIPEGTKLVIFQPGGNDKRIGGRRGSASSSEANIRAVVQLLKKRGVLVILSTSQFGQIAEDEHIPVVGEIARLALEDLSADGEHLTGAGYAKVAAKLKPVVEEELQKAGIVPAAPSPTAPGPSR